MVFNKCVLYMWTSVVQVAVIHWNVTARPYHPEIPQTPIHKCIAEIFKIVKSFPVYMVLRGDSSGCALNPKAAPSQWPSMTGKQRQAHSSPSDLGLKTPHWPCRNFQNCSVVWIFLPALPAFTFFFTGFTSVVWSEALSASSAPSPFPLTGISHKKFLALRILSWYQLLKGPELRCWS